MPTLQDEKKINQEKRALCTRGGKYLFLKLLNAHYVQLLVAQVVCLLLGAR